LFPGSSTQSLGLRGSRSELPDEGDAHQDAASMKGDDDFIRTGVTAMHEWLMQLLAQLRHFLCVAAYACEVPSFFDLLAERRSMKQKLQGYGVLRRIEQPRRIVVHGNVQAARFLKAGNHFC
jgi:hypothetical protein